MANARVANFSGLLYVAGVLLSTHRHVCLNLWRAIVTLEQKIITYWRGPAADGPESGDRLHVKRPFCHTPAFFSDGTRIPHFRKKSFWYLLKAHIYHPHRLIMHISFKMRKLFVKNHGFLHKQSIASSNLSVILRRMHGEWEYIESAVSVNLILTCPSIPREW